MKTKNMLMRFANRRPFRAGTAMCAAAALVAILGFAASAKGGPQQLDTVLEHLHTKPWLTGTHATNPQSGPQTTTHVGIVVPTDVRHGDETSCSVTLLPLAYAHYPALRVLPFDLPLSSGADGKPTLHGLRVDLGFGPGPADGAVRCNIQDGGGTLHVVVARDDGGNLLITNDLPYKPVSADDALTSIPVPAQTGAPGDFQTTPVCMVGAVQMIHGPFNGDARDTHLTVDGKPGRIVAETPRALYWLFPDAPVPSDTTLALHEGPRSAQFRIFAIDLAMSADHLQLLKGQSTPFHARISGLAGLPAAAWEGGMPSELTDLSEVRRLAPNFRMPPPSGHGVVLCILDNASRDVVTIEHAHNEVIVLTLGQADFSSGSYQYDGVIHSKRSGGFAVNGLVIPFLAPVPGVAVQ